MKIRLVLTLLDFKLCPMERARAPMFPVGQWSLSDAATSMSHHSIPDWRSLKNQGLCWRQKHHPELDPFGRLSTRLRRRTRFLNPWRSRSTSSADHRNKEHCDQVLFFVVVLQLVSSTPTLVKSAPLNAPCALYTLACTLSAANTQERGQGPVGDPPLRKSSRCPPLPSRLLPWDSQQ